MLDLLITNGQIIDGAGGPGFYASVGVRGEDVEIIRGDVSHVEAARVIDATGHVVSPGFIDVHSHGGFTILKEPLHEPKVRQGVTTELIGIDGNSAAPFKTQEDLHRFIEMDAGLNDRPPMPADWSSVADFLALYNNNVSVNICYILGNSPVRIWSVGWDDRPATGAEIEDMKSVIREAMEDGAFGLSTGLDYPPGGYADTNELIELSKTTSAQGGFYHTHTRASLKSQGLLAPWHEAIEIGRKSGIPVHLTHYRQSAQGVGSHLDYIGLVEDARAEGMDVTFDCYPYIYSSTRATIELPLWTMDGGPERIFEVLSNPDDRARLVAEMKSGGRDATANWLTNLQKEHNKQYEGLSVKEIGRMRGQDPVEAFLDILLDDGLDLCIVGVGYQRQYPARFCVSPLRHGRQRRSAHGRVPQPPHLRLLPRNPRRERTRRKAAPPPRGHPQDDLLPRPAPGPQDPWPPPRRLQGRHHNLQPGNRQSPRHPRKPQAVPPRHPLRHSQRQSRSRRRPTLRPTPRPSPPLRPRLTPKIPSPGRRRGGPVPSPSMGEG